MAAVNDEAVWEEEVYQLEETDPVQGGKEGIDNKPHAQLARRTSFLKRKLEEAAGYIPIGIPYPWFSDSAPQGFAIMKGQEFDKEANPNLAILFPSGYLPDLRGCGLIGKENDEAIATFEEGQVKEHGHPNSIASSTDLGTKSTNVTGSHNHSYSIYANQFNPNTQRPVTGATGAQTGYTNHAGNHAHHVVIGAHTHAVQIASFGAAKNTIDHWKVNFIVRLG
ncbi:hypothetical protein GCM10007938_43210 [Vibrio zhanjiangensis]|uniref:Phage tail collar domain-containing protein n=1 Tax=Vibrio zhanjiangensis TaxID=1046128 RepID=A0ABQ6F6V2_9VIBR|nr:phage tail protein [Vibrio zhanjiangensis]GLT20536.1 hypothetical protein GCM10007938_43210 [Vibrio zhanjiangensis]